MKTIKIDSKYYTELAINGSVSFPHLLEEKHGLELDTQVLVTHEIDDDLPLPVPITATISQMSASIIVDTKTFCAITVEHVSAASLGGRLAHTLMGHHYELQAAFARSGAHKLPGSKGRLRENALAKFLQVWIPRRIVCPSNVFLTHETAGNFDVEIDLALYDSSEGPMWPLDGEDENWILAYRHTKAVFEVKSTLDDKTIADAIKSILAFNDYVLKVEEGEDRQTEDVQDRPFMILFAYRIDEKFASCNFQELLVYGPNPFDLIIVLGKGAYFSKGHAEMAIAFRHKLTVSEAREDMFASSDILANDFEGHTRAYIRASSRPDDTLMALVYALTERCAGSALTAALLSALSVRGSVVPFEFSQSHELDGEVGDTVANTRGPATQKQSQELENLYKTIGSDDPVL